MARTFGDFVIIIEVVLGHFNFIVGDLSQMSWKWRNIYNGNSGKGIHILWSINKCLIRFPLNYFFSQMSII